jgi:hypothetical protein
MDLLVEHAPQAHRIQTDAAVLGSIIRIQVELSGCMSIDVAVKASYTQARPHCLAVVRSIEFLLGEGCYQQAEPIELYWRQEVFK